MQELNVLAVCNARQTRKRLCKLQLKIYSISDGLAEGVREIGDGGQGQDSGHGLQL